MQRKCAPVCVACCDSQLLLACVVLTLITLAMWLSPEFVNNLVAVLNVLASQVATALDTLNFEIEWQGASGWNPFVRTTGALDWNLPS